ncbi:MAG: porin family protein [Lactobacillus sp.]|jgi:opacity protein-like surface antigen|nr:porin family protein [Lactobacillus sp.]
MKKTLGTMMVAATALVIAGNANALEYNPYVGVDYSHSKTNVRMGGGNGHFGPHHDSAIVNVGMDIGKYFGTEVFYQRSGTDKRNKHGNEFNTIKTWFRAYGIDAYGYLPFGCDLKFALLGTVGVGEYNMHSKQKRSGGKDETDHGYGWRAGVGAQYRFTDTLSARALVRNVNFEGIHDVDHMFEYVAGVRYTFEFIHRQD